MFKKIKNIFCLSSFLIFFILIIFYYLSPTNTEYTNKIKIFYSADLITNIKNLPLLKNDTNDIIEYTNDAEDYKNSKKKYKFWDLIKK
jgi:hypothetical protein